MGKKKPEEMATQREIFIAGALKNGVDKDHSAQIFNLMERFAGYGFNKPHLVLSTYLMLTSSFNHNDSHHPRL